MRSKWFVVTIIMQCIVDGSEQTAWTVDRQLRVVRAIDADEAYDRAAMVGRIGEHAYENEYGQQVRWVVVGVQAIEEVLAQTIRDGTELTSELLLDTVDPTALVVTKAELVRRQTD